MTETPHHCMLNALLYKGLFEVATKIKINGQKYCFSIKCGDLWCISYWKQPAHTQPRSQRHSICVLQSSLYQKHIPDWTARPSASPDSDPPLQKSSITGETRDWCKSLTPHLLVRGFPICVSMIEWYSHMYLLQIKVRFMPKLCRFQIRTTVTTNTIRNDV